MKNIKLLIVIFLFSSFLVGCGMKGPLYRKPVAQAKAAEQATAILTATAEHSQNSPSIY